MYNAEAIESLIYESSVPHQVVFGRGTRWKLIPLGKDFDREELSRDIAEGMRYVGLLGVVDGRPTQVLRTDWNADDITAMMQAGLAFARQATASTVAPVVDDFIAFAEHLASLPDPRGDHA